MARAKHQMKTTAGMVGAPKDRADVRLQTERAVVAAVRLPTSRYDVRDPYGELRALAEQAGATVVGEISQVREAPESGTYMGRGKVLELKALCDTLDAGVVIFDHELSPKQIAKIEELTERKILDRSELILDIFASRAITHEAKLQVELAQLQYTIPRLRAMWDHLERIVGGGGIAGIGTRGPGEQQLEIDRRLAQKKRLNLERQLEEIQARRRREVRARKQGNFTVGIVGYTNAGKSTLFNTLTTLSGPKGAGEGGGAYADDRVFATLISRTRPWDLGAIEGTRSTASSASGEVVLLTDTVGFVRDLPHHLVASFRATLDEAVHADVLLIVLDVSDPASQLQHEAVNQTLDQLFAEAREDAEYDGVEWREPQRILLLNKVDRLEDNRELLAWQSRVPDAIAISALPPPVQTAAGLADHTGHRELAQRVRSLAAGSTREVTLTLPLSDARSMAFLEKHARVLERTFTDRDATFRVRIAPGPLAKLQAQSPT